MCDNCARRHAEAMEQANAEMDEQGVPEDSLIRGMADISIACEHHPVLKALMREMYPTTSTLTQ